MKRKDSAVSQSVREACTRLGRVVTVGRKARDWRQEDLADNSNVSRSTVGEIEKGSPFVSILNYMQALDAVGMLHVVCRPDEQAEMDSLMEDKLPRRVRSK